MQLETERLILRPIDPDHDLDGWASAMSDERTVKYLGTAPMDRAQSWRNMATVMGHWQIRGYGFFSVIEKSSGQWVGRVGPWNPEGWPAPEIGWTIAPSFWGRGYAKEAALASLDYVFNELNWPQVIHVILDGNEASVGVAKSIGSTFWHSLEGLPAITDETVHVYGQRRRD